VREPPPAGRRVERLAAAAVALGRPPATLSARARWLFLLFGLATMAMLAVRTAAGGHAGWPLRAAATGGLVLLAGWWVAALRRPRAAAAGAAAEAAVLFLAVVAAPQPREAIALLYAGAFYHTMVARSAWAALRVALCLAAVAAAAGLRPRPDAVAALAEVLAQAPNLAAVTALAFLLGDVLRRHERATARERVLSKAAGELLEAADPTAIRRTAAAAAARLSAGEEAPPAEARDALGSLQAQAALALDRAALTAELSRRATVDPLTGLANRSLLLERLDQALAGAAAEGANCALLLLDLDDFKTVNDSLGHLSGDGVLVAVAERLRERLRPGDTAARLGGDEFAVVLERVAGAPEALALAERLAAELRKPLAAAGRLVQARASVGVRVAAGGDPDELLRDADLAMYAAKTAGHGTVQLFDTAMHERAVRRLDFEADLRTAVLEQQFTVRYQPVVQLDDGAVIGLEALIRWDHPQRGLVMPGEFVGMAEQSGLIVPIGRWVLHAACQAARDWQRRFPLARPLFIGVNLSVRQLQQPDLVQDVAGAVDAAGLDPAALVLELTESQLVLDDEATVERLRQLRALGVHVALDDFGTGYSSLAYLRRLPLDALKLAKPFVDGLTAGAEQAALAQAIMRLAETLGLQVVAEGIEQPAQVEALLQLGCRYGQGFHFARPLDQFAVEALLAAEQDRHARLPAASRTTAR
jgi:diguanylate cyclase (GGDEF)-like protein